MNAPVAAVPPAMTDVSWQGQYDYRKAIVDDASMPAELRQHYAQELAVMAPALKAQGIACDPPPTVKLDGPSPASGGTTGAPGSTPSKQVDHTNSAPGGPPPKISSTAGGAPPIAVGEQAPARPAGGPGMVGPANGKWDATIEKYAAKYNVDPNLVKAVIRKESNGDPGAVSSADALGLGQLKVGTASMLAGRPVSRTELLTNTDLNVELTCKNLARLSQLKGGSTAEVLGSYNQGEFGNWRTSAEGADYVSTITSWLKAGKIPAF